MSDQPTPLYSADDLPGDGNPSSLPKLDAADIEASDEHDEKEGE